MEIPGKHLSGNIGAPQAEFLSDIILNEGIDIRVIANRPRHLAGFDAFSFLLK
jgi:hypothetical protein